ncbi:MAG TPA: peptide deformylase [Patescibacteria group bacterium]|nr:peptide deformylase [Patescibacteria group bacterium]
MSLKIRIYGDRVLRTKGKEVEEFGSVIAPLLEQMVETMLVEGGVGLAAPQVGVSKRIAVVNPEPKNSETLIAMINPHIVVTSSETTSVEEGCLSVPDIRGNVIRPTSIEVAYQDGEGREHRIEIDGIVARIIQHEVDHLDGILFVDRLSLATKALIRSRLRNMSHRSKRET